MASVARGSRRRNSVATAATTYATQLAVSHAVPDSAGVRGAV